MPLKWWIHYCKCFGNGWHGTGLPICKDCGSEGVFEGWGYTGFELMCNHSSVVGIQQNGLHADFIRERLLPFVKKCKECDRKGMFTVNDGEDYILCIACKGNSYILTIDDKEANRIRKIARKMIKDEKKEKAAKKPPDRIRK